MDPETEVYELLIAAIEKLKQDKPDCRSALDRYYATCITDMEKLIAYYAHYIASTR